MASEKGGFQKGVLAATFACIAVHTFVLVPFGLEPVLHLAGDFVGEAGVELASAVVDSPVFT